ncbi:MAG: carboxypeptidase regulatory-like domain-containing protein, partial [Candidatus Electryonea clarkiae]|nr:carboxypeptidase regulatory-like domain-containing protein [Candidatus Electryonea clarkiae]
QFDIATQSLTGVTHDCSDAPGFNAGISGGAATYCADGKLILLANIQQDPNLIVAYELAPFATWIAIDPNAGTVDPYGAFEEVTVTFDAGDDPAGTIHTCDILFESAQGVPSVTVPVTLMVGNPEYGTLTGTVTAATGGALIEGAEITASDDADNTYVTYTNASGVYTIEDMMVGYYTVECTADGYNYHVEVDVPITAGNVTTLNFALLAPVMTVNPLVINTSVDPATPIQVDITIDNDGDGPLEWFASLDQPVSIPRESGNHPVGPNAVSAEGVPQGLDPVYGANEPNFTLTRGSVGWGIEAVDGSGCWIDTDAPDILNDVFVPTFATYAGEFGPDNDTHMYFFDNDTQNLIYVEMATGTVTTIGPTGIGSTTEFMNDMACDRTTGTMYGVFNNSIYTVDLATGACTLVGAIGNTGGMMIAIAVDGNGDMWGHDLGLDEIWTIDKATGTGMSVGSTGFDANYAQSMAWDPLTNIVYLAAFNGTNFYYELRTVDLTTGATALLGGVYYKEIVAFSFPGDATTPWITIGPSSDVVPAGGTSTLCVFLNTVDYPIGEILFANIEIISDPDVGVVTVPVTVIVSDTVSSGETPVIETSLYANFPNPMLNSTTFNFSLRERSHVTLSIYNVKGQLVDVILNEDLDPCAQHPVVWNGTANGKKLANGIYFYKLETNSKTFLKKMILMK